MATKECKKHDEKACLCCGKEFKMTTGTPEYCSAGCRSKHEVLADLLQPLIHAFGLSVGSFDGSQGLGTMLQNALEQAYDAGLEANSAELKNLRVFARSCSR